MKREEFPHLLAPLSVGSHTYRNRVVSAPRGGIWNEAPDCHDADPEQLAEVDLRAGGGQAALPCGGDPGERRGRPRGQ